MPGGGQGFMQDHEAGLGTQEQVEPFRSVFVPKKSVCSDVYPIKVVTLYDIRDGIQMCWNTLEKVSNGLGTDVKGRVDSSNEPSAQSRRPRRRDRRIHYREVESDQSSEATSLASIFSMSDVDECEESEETEPDSSLGGIHSVLSSEEASMDLSIDENYREVAYIDAFKRVGPMKTYTMIAPCVISRPGGLLPKDSDDTSSLTMSMSDKNESAPDIEMSEVQQSRGRKRSLLDTLADAAELASKKTTGSKKSTKQQVVQRVTKKAPMDSWYPGYDIKYGMVCVHCDAFKGFSHPEPVYQGEAPRWKCSVWSDDMLPAFQGDDDVLKSIQYLKCASITAGSLIAPPLEVQSRVNKQYIAFEGMLENITSVRRKLLHGGMPTRDTRITRKSYKKQNEPSFPIIFSPSRHVNAKERLKTLKRHGLKSTAAVQGDPAAATDVRWGSCYQAEIPSFSKRNQTSSEQKHREQRLEGDLILKNGTVPHAYQDVLNLVKFKSMTRDQRERAILDRSNKLIDSIGTGSDLLGLNKMGAHVKDMLSQEQQILYGEGISKYGRDFKRIQKELLPTISCGSLAAYYYDVWKMRSIPAAAQYYQGRDEASSRAVSDNATTGTNAGE